MVNSPTLPNWLTSPRSTISLPFRAVDVAKQAKARRLAERGSEDGAKNLPPSGAADLALAEQEVVTDMRAERDRCATHLASHLRAYRDGLSTLQTAMRVAEMRHSADEAVTRLREIRSLWSGEIDEIRTKAVQVTAEMQEFKQKNKISRIPRLPDDRFLSLSLLILFIVVESVLNGLFFASGSDLGILGGVLLALALSVLNVTAGALNGFTFLRMKNSARWFLSIPALLAFFGIEGTIVAFNALVAHYRDVYQDMGDATKIREIWSHLLLYPFDLQSIYSWLLFASGLFFSGAATWKGYGFDDPLPGYGATERRRAAAVATYADDRRALIEEAREITEDYGEKALQAIEALRAASSQRQQILAARARLVAEYRAVEANLAESAQQLLRIYRESNARARVAALPAHFNDRFMFHDVTVDRPEFQILLTDQGMEHDADTLIGELDNLRRRVLDEHSLVLEQAPGEV